MPNFDKENKKVSAVILTWNGLDFTKKCIESLISTTESHSIEIVVVDNGSTDGTVEYLKGLQGDVKVILNKTNEGYAKAVNKAIASSDPDSDIILINNDLVFIQEDWFKRMVERIESNPRIGVLGVKILKNEHELQHCGAYIPLDTLWGQQIAGGEVDIGQYSGLNLVESVVFACAYIRREVIEKVGLLDEAFFAYFEDTDYCLRTNNAGFDIGIDGDIKVLHFENSSTKVNKVSHSSIFLKSQKTFSNKWASTLKNERYSNGALDFHSVANLPTGYANSAKSYMHELDRLRVNVAYKYVYGPGTVFPVVEPSMSDSYTINMLSSRKFGKAPIQVVYAQGDMFYKNTGEYKVGSTMLEVDGLPSEWVRQANMMDEIWVPSEFNRETFINSGVKKPIHIIPLGVDTNYFSPEIKGERATSAYTFLSIFEWGTRKAPDVLLRAFADEFSEDEEVVLICKVNNFDGSISLQQEIAQLGLRKNSAKIRILSNKITSSYELGVLYNSADCFVLPTRGEGWGMPILEAMACGLPTIATNWSAQKDFMTKENSLPLEIDSLVPAVAKCPYYEGFNWSQPSYEHLRYLLRWVFENRDKAKEIGNQAQADARQYWSWENAAQKIVERIKANS